MSTSKKRRNRRRKRSYSTRQENPNTHNTQLSEEDSHEPQSKKAKYGDHRRRSDRIKTKINYNDDQYDSYIIDTEDDEDIIMDSETQSPSNSNESDDEQEIEDDDTDDIEIQSDEYDENEDLDQDNKPLFTSNLIRNHRTLRAILNHDQLNKEEVVFKSKAYHYVNNYFESNLKNSKQIWMDQHHKYQSQKEELSQQNQGIKVSPFARGTVISHASFLKDVAQNVSKTSKYLHITGSVEKEYKTNEASDNEHDDEGKEMMEGDDDDIYRIDAMIEPITLALNENACPIPHNTPYITVNRNHYMKDDAKLRYIPLIGTDMYEDDMSGSDTEFEEQEDILLDYIYENLELDDDETVNKFEKVFYLSFERIQHRIMALSHHKEKLLKQQKKTLILNGYDTKNKDIPIDSFSLLFCPRCMTYDCSLHGLDNPRRRDRALPSDTILSEKCDYFGIINNTITDPNVLAITEGNHSLSNHMIAHILPKEYTPCVVYPLDLSECTPCGNDCYITYVRNDRNALSEAEQIEWSYMDLSNLRRLLNICKKNFCQIASIMDSIISISCTNVYLKAMELIPDLVPYVQEKARDGKDKKLRKKAPDIVLNRMREAVELNAENIPHQFFGCRHDGICSQDNNCSCIMNQTHCEKYCNCNMDCRQRFPGCCCGNDSDCNTDKCPCFRSHRECDPDKCIECQSYLTPDMFDKAIEWLKNNDSEYYCAHYKNEAIEEGKDNGDDNKEDVLIEIDGIANINPYKLCGNLCCTQQRKKKLWIGKSDVHGFGCFAGETILKNEYITEYLGEMITQNEADRRGRVYDEFNISYLFNLNSEYCVDATRKGSKMKFANHSIKPNCRAKIITVNGDHRICIYAKKHLQIGQELLFDYRHDNVDSAQQPNWFHHNQK